MLDYDLILMFVLCFQTYIIEKNQKNTLLFSLFLLFWGLFGVNMLSDSTQTVNSTFYTFCLLFSLVYITLHIYFSKKEKI